MAASGPVHGGLAGTGHGDLAEDGTESLSESPSERALSGLLAGNRRFRDGRPAHPRQDLRRVREVSSGQHPLAMALGCADSRVPAEILFDQGIGDLFSLRVAGNIVDGSVLGSLEYAAEHLHVPLLLVLGHSGCGAVAATVDSHRTGEIPTDHVGAIVEAIRPAVEPVLNATDPATPSDVVMRECSIANVEWAMGQIRSRSQLVAELEAEGRLAVVGGYYDLGSGAVSLIS
jgi:carbonic anhydrase